MHDSAEATDPALLNLISAFTAAADDATEAAAAAVGSRGSIPAALVLLRARPGLSLEELRQPLGLSQPGAVRLVDRVEAAGWVKRQRPAGRRLALSLTAAGRRLVDRLLTQRAVAQAGLLEPLTGAERHELKRLLAKLVARRVNAAADRERVCRLCDRGRCVPCAAAAAVAEAEARARRLADLDLELRFEHGDTPEDELRRLLADAEAAGDQAAVARIEARLAMPAMARGDYSDVITRLERARPQLTLDSDALAVATLARAYALTGRADDAVSLLKDTLAEVERARHSPVVWLRYAVYLTYALTDAGRYAEARDVLRRAAWRSRRVDELHTRVRVHWAAGRLAMFEHDLRPARRHFAHVIRLLEGSEDEPLLGRAHISQASIHILAGRAREAAESLLRAEALLGPRPDKEDRYWLRIEQARQALLSPDPQRALGLANEAVGMIGVRDTSARGAALAVRARALAAEGDLEAADAAFAEAVALLREQREWFAAAAAADAWAEMLTSGGRSSPAEQARQAAADLHAQAAAASRRPPQARRRPAPGVTN